MYHPTEMANALTPTSCIYSLYTHASPNQNQLDYPSRLEILFLLDSGASISVFNYATDVIITQLLDIKQNSPHNLSKTLTVANQTEVPISHYVTLTSNTTIEDDSRQFIIPVAVADIEYSILGTQFFEENSQNIIIQDFILQFKHFSRVYSTQTIQNLLQYYPKIIHISHLSIKSIVEHKSSKIIYSKIAHFPINNY